MANKKILFIIPYIPYPLDSGGNQAFFNMVDYIRQRYSVSLLLYPTNSKQKKNVESLKKIWDNVDFHIFSIDKEKEGPEMNHSFYYRWLKKAQASISRKLERLNGKGAVDTVRQKSTLFRAIFKRFDSEYVEFVSRVSRSGFDLIQVEFYELIGLGYVLPEDVETIFVHHELMYIRNKKEMSLFQTISAEDRMLYRVAKDFERDALLTYKHVVALTDTDRSLLEKLLGNKVYLHCSPAIVRMEDSISQLAFTAVKNRRLTFVGSKDHFPNLDAVEWFCKEVTPCLRRKGFHFTFQVVGKWSGSSVQRLRTNCPEIEFVGYVENLHSFLNGSIFIVPIRIGSGMRMKILDAVYAKIPFITTSNGVEGIDFRHHQECLIADSVEDFANEIIRLANDIDLQEILTKQANERLRLLYDPQKMLECRLAIYEKILN